MSTRARILWTPWLGAAIISLGLGGCRKTEVVNLGYLPPFALPDSLALTYGQRVQLSLPAEYQDLPDVTLRLSFKDNAPQQLTATDSLTTLLARAVTVSQATRQVSINTELLYPTHTSSASSGQRTPDNYLVTLTASSAAGFKAVQSRLKIKVLPGQLKLAELNDADKIPYGYGIYDNKPLAFTVAYAGLDSTGTRLQLDVNGRPDGKVTLVGRHVVVAPDAGNAAQKYEWTYDLLPTLTKDGYRVAYRQFRVVLLPQPRFFFGEYHPDLNLTVLLNRVVIQLGAAYTSPAPAFYPAKYKGPFTLKSIEKDGQLFTDARRVFSVDAATGAVTVAPNLVLTAGEYKLSVQTQNTTGLTQTTTLTLVMES